MLESKNLNDKDYEDFIAEAIAKISLYSDEWTNCNPSDPGITILENFCAFAALQRSFANDIPDEVVWKLLKLNGIEKEKGSAAEILAKKPAKETWDQPCVPGQKFYSGEVCFEYGGADKAEDVDFPSYFGGASIKLVQKDTRSALLYVERQQDCLRISHALMEEGSFDIYGKCGSSYELLPQQSYSIQRIGQYTAMVFLKEGIRCSRFLAAIYSGSILAYKELGRIWGYDNQEFDLPLWERIYGRDFCILVERNPQSGIFVPVKPDDAKANMLHYTVEESRGKIIINDCGACEGSKILLGNCSIYSGDGGNIMPGTLLEMQSAADKPGVQMSMQKAGRHVRVCKVVREGRYEDGIEGAVKKLKDDISNPTTAVTKQDFERIVKEMPGLSLSKVCASVDEEKNEVRIVIMPDSSEPLPKLSDTVRRTVEDYLLDRRLLSTRIAVEQPRYVAIGVDAVIAVKKYSSAPERQIRQAICNMLDGTRPGREFGEQISLHDIFRGLAKLPCVEEIHDLALTAEGEALAKTKGAIRLESHELCFPGNISLELLYI